MRAAVGPACLPPLSGYVRTMRHILPIALFLTGACVSRTAPPVTQPAAPPAAAAPRLPDIARDWIDRPLSAGTWRYSVSGDGGTRASFGTGEAAELFSIECRAKGQALLARRTLTANPPAGQISMTLRATSGGRAFPASSGDGRAAVAEIAPPDSHLDALAFSRGRILVAVPGTTDLILPAWPEIARVIEDCR